MRNFESNGNETCIYIYIKICVSVSKCFQEKKKRKKRKIESEIKIIHVCTIFIFELIGIASRNNNIGATKDFIHCFMARRSNYEAHQNVISFRVKIFRDTPPATISIDYQLRIHSCLKFNREIKNFHSFFFLTNFFSFCSYINGKLHGPYPA